MSGKGSRRRPQIVSDQQVSDNWERAFGSSNDDVIDEKAIERLKKRFKSKVPSKHPMYYHVNQRTYCSDDPEDMRELHELMTKPERVKDAA